MMAAPFPALFFRGPLMNLCLFLMSGLPGGIDYAMLAAVKTGRMDRLREKELNTLINTWIRIPGLVMVGVVAWCCLMHGRSPRRDLPPPWQWPSQPHSTRATPHVDEAQGVLKRAGKGS